MSDTPAENNTNNNCEQLQKDFIVCYYNKKGFLPNCHDVIQEYIKECGSKKLLYCAILATH